MEKVYDIKDLKEFTVHNPANGTEAGVYKLMDRNEVDETVKKAKESFNEWSKTDFKTRKKILKKAINILSENAEKYAEVISSETGKTKMDALLADIFSALDLFKHYAKKAEKILKPVRVSGSLIFPGRKAYHIYEPKGVIGVISPWNYPFTLSAGPVISAIMAGNTVVLKPSSQTTKSGLILKEILDKAGLPGGVMHVLTGNGRITGQALIENESLDMLFFTGSTPVGKEVNLQAAKRLIPAIMELGGKDVAIVTKNANLDRAAHGVLWGGMTNSGQTCIGTELALVEKRVFDEFVEKIKNIAVNLESGEKAGQVGSMTMRSQFDLVFDQLDDAVKKGAEIVVGGGVKKDQESMYFPPTILTRTTPDMKVRKDETFGPLLPIIPFETISEAVEIANSTEYGLSGAVFTNDMDEGREIAARIKTGSVNINDVLITYALPSLPFGGVKKSGVGSYHAETGLRAFTNIKSITEFKWKLKREIFWYPVPEGSEKVLSAAITAYFSSSIVKRISALASVVAQIWKIRKS